MKKITSLTCLLVLSSPLKAGTFNSYFIRGEFLTNYYKVNYYPKCILGAGYERTFYNDKLYISIDSTPILASAVLFLEGWRFYSCRITGQAITYKKEFVAISNGALEILQITGGYLVGLGYSDKKRGFCVYLEPAGLFYKNRFIGVGINKMYTENISITLKGGISLDGYMKRLGIGISYHF